MKLPTKVPKKTLIAAGVVLASYALFGFFILPGIVKSNLIEAVSQATGQTPEVGDVSTNPFALSLTVRDFSLPDRSGERLVSFHELYVNFELISVFTQAYTFSEISIELPYIRSLVRRDGSVNLMDVMLAGGADSASLNEPPVPVHVDHFVLSGGALVYEDRQRTTPFVARMDSLDLSLRDFTTRPNEEGVYQFDAKTDRGEEIRWKGTVSVVPLRSAGSLALSGFGARTVWEFLRDQVRYEITSGTMRFQADYVLDLSKDPMVFTIAGGEGEVTSLGLRDRRDGSEAVSVPRVTASGVEADVMGSKLTVGQVSSSGGTVQGRHLSDSTLTLQTLFEMDIDPLAPASKSAPWKVLLKRLEMHDYTIRIQDETTEPLATLEFAPLALTLENYPYGLPGEASLELSTGVNGAGTAALRGIYTPEPASSSFDITLEKVGLLGFQPYVNGMAGLDLRSGTLSLKGRARQRERNGRPATEFDGDVWVESFRATDRVLEEDFLRWKRLDVKGVSYRSDPGSLTVNEIIARGAYLRAIINEDHTSNIQQIMLTGADSAAVDTTASSAGRIPTKIPSVRVVDSEIHFSDLSLTPNFIVSIQNVEGEITGLSSVDTTRASMTLNGRVDKYAPASITGEVNLLSERPYTDVLLNFKGIELTTFSPYSGKFAGYKIDKGKMTLDLHYVLADRYVKGENRIILDQLTLGEEVESPDATSLPVKLAIALLKDKDGVIDLDIPVEGSLDDPEFSFFPVILKALVNVFIKIVTSPFALLGAIFGGGEELSYVDFTPGIDTLALVEQAKLDSLGRALTERPGLQVDIRGAVAMSVDREALARAAVLRQVRGGGDTTSSTVSRKDLDRVRALYLKQFQEEPELLLAQGGEKADALTGEKREVAILDSAFQRLVDTHQVTGAELEALAHDRALAIKDYLVFAAGVGEQRVFLLDNDLEASAEDGGVRIHLALDAP
jgi:hypothetical protein